MLQEIYTQAEQIWLADNVHAVRQRIASGRQAALERQRRFHDDLGGEPLGRYNIHISLGT
jgi:hypothetical protein